MTKKKLLTDFLKGELTEQERQDLYHWLSDEDNEGTEDFMKAVWKKTTGSNIHHINKEALLKKVDHKAREVSTLDEDKRTKAQDRLVYSAKRRRRGYSHVIILCLLLCSVSASLYLNSQKERPIPEVKEIAKIVKQTARGFRSSLLLRDGSKVTLNSESKLIYDEHFGVTNRTIHLEGEAFFEVAEDPTKPFVVISKNLTTKALGTSFNVRDYADETSASIALATGKVVVNSTHNTNDSHNPNYTLSPTEHVVMNKKDLTMEKGHFDANKMLSWKDDVLYFSNTKLIDIIKTLERWYDVKIILKGNGLEKLTFEGTGEFPRQSLEMVLHSLGYSMGFTSTINGKHIVITLNDSL